MVNLFKAMQNKVLFMIFLMMGTFVFAQTKVQIAGGGVLFSHPTKKGVLVLQDNAVLLIEGITIKCDWAEVNQVTNDFEARTNLRIITKEKAVITGDYLTYQGATKILVIDRNVKMVDGPTVMTTDRVVYNKNTDLFTYNTGGRIEDNETVLTSRIGHYESKTRTFYCSKDVKIENPEYLILSDTMSNRQGVSYFHHATNIYMKDMDIYCEKGWYDSKNEKAFLYENAFIDNKDQKLYGDSIYYDIKQKIGLAYSNVKMIDSARAIIVESNYAENNEKTGKALFSKEAIATIISDNDSLYVHGDTLRIHYDTAHEVKYLLAYHHVKFFRHDMQGKCDSLAYLVQDSLMQMFHNPILWAESNQLTSDSIKLFIVKNKPKMLFLDNNAFISSSNKKDSTWFNQIKGVRMVGFFADNGQMQYVDVYNNAESIYFVMDEGVNELIGINKALSKNLRIYISDSKVSGINMIEPKEAFLYPEEQLDPKKRVLKGFQWFEKYRPIDKKDILRW